MATEAEFWADVAKRFWAKASRGGPEDCWNWHGACDSDGRGQMSIRNRKEKAPRISWMMHRKEDPGVSWVLHKCDNPRCVNPEHLFLGDATVNNRDMTAKGRHGHTGSAGESHPSAKLTEQDVRDIRANKALCRVSLAELGRRYGIGRGAVWSIVTKRTWSHI